MNPLFIVCILYLEVILGSASVHRDACLDIGGVQNLQQRENVVSWEAPLYADTCLVYYAVVHEDNSGVKEFYLTNTSYTFDLISCASNKISVTAVANAHASEVTTAISFQNPILGYIPAPVSLGVVPGSTTAETYWQAAPVSEHACIITSFLITVRSGPILQHARVDLVDNDSRIFKIDLQDLIPGKQYQISGIVWSHTLRSAQSEVAEFITRID